MDQRAQFLIQILEKIGSPLLASVTEVSAGDGAPDKDAMAVASLLAKTVQLSIDIGNTTELAAGAPDDSLRVALAALAGPLIGGLYRQNGQLPSDNDLKRVSTALQAVMTFSENFTPDAQNIERLRNLKAGNNTPDASQVSLQYIQAFTPVINAIATFTFGQKEQKLVMDITSRLTNRALHIRETITGLQEETEQKLAELAILRALCALYAACHTAETTRLSSSQQAPDAGLSMDPVWNNFELRAAMLETLVQGMGATRFAAGGGTSSKAPTAPVQAQAAPAAPPFTPPPSAPAEAPKATPSAVSSPLSMFAKPGGQIPAPPPTSPPPQEQQQGGGPMSFFKKSEN